MLYAIKAFFGSIEYIGFGNGGSKRLGSKERLQE